MELAGTRASAGARSTPHPRRDGEGSGLSEQVQDALSRLHDPTYLQTHPLARLATGTQATKASNAGKVLRLALEEAVEAVKPTAATPERSHGWRGYELLRLRYLEGQDVRAVLGKLAISRSEYYRDHKQAIEAVAGVLSQRWGLGEAQAPANGAVREVGEPAARVAEPVGSTPSNLPLALTSFVGRERQIAEVQRLLGERRLVTLTGSGGCGKTRLALEVARYVANDYPDGAWLIGLASLADPELLPQTVAFTLGVRETAGEPIAATLASYLRSKALLLILDDCEHLVDSCASLAMDLLRGCPKLTIVATSRQSLGIGGETVWQVPPLDTARPDGSPALEALAGNEAIRLFADRASAVVTGFRLTPQNAAAVAEICWRLDGIPLAIELAAARTRALAVEQIAHRLDDRFGLLTSGSRSALPRQQTLRAAIDWSHNLLTAPEKALFRRLAVFQGGWTLEAAEDVCIGEEVARGDVLDLLSRLVDKSLALVESRTGEARYRLLATVLEYARERLAEAGEEDAVRGRHRDHFLRLGEKALAIIWRSDEQGLLIDRLEADHDNLRSALRWCQTADPSAFLRLAASLWTFWDTKGYTAEGRRWIEEALAVAPERDSTRAEALRGAGLLAADQGDGATATLHWEECLHLCRELGDRHGEGLTLAFLGSAAGERGADEQAQALLEESSALLQQTEDWLILGWALKGLGSVAGLRGDYPRAREYLEEAYTLSLRARTDATWELCGLGLTISAEGDYERARRYLEAALAMAVEARDEPGRGYVLAELGNLARLSGDHYGARTRIAEGLEVLRAIGQRQRIGSAIALFALLAADEGRHQRVACLLGAAISTHEHFGTNLWKWERVELDASTSTARTALGEEAFARAWAEGQAMSLEQAVEYALAGDEDAPDVR